MRSTALLALAAASGFAFAEQSDSFEAIKSLVDSDLKASAAGSFKTSGNIGTTFLPSKDGAAAKESSTDSPSSSDLSSRDTQNVYGQCGGGSYSGPTSCPSGQQCYKRDASYSQCLPTVQQAYGQCGGNSYFGTSACAAGSSCKQLRSDYSQCIPSGGAKTGAKSVAEPDTVDMEAADMDPKHTAEGQDEDPVHASMSAEMASAYKTETAAAPPAYTSEAATMMTEDTMMAMPTMSMSTEETSMMKAMPTEESSSMMAMPTMSAAKTSSSPAMAMPTHYGSMNGTKTAGSPAASGTGMGAPKPYEGAASSLMVPGVIVGGMAVFFGMVI